MTNLETVAIRISRESLLAWHQADPEAVAAMQFNVATAKSINAKEEAFVVTVSENDLEGYEAEIAIAIDKEPIDDFYGASACLVQASPRCHEDIRQYTFPHEWHHGFYCAKAEAV